MTRLLAICSIALLLTACGSDDDSAAYNFDLNIGQATEGVAEVTITVTSNTNETLPETDITVTPLMIMSSNGKEHGTPMESTFGQLDDDGVFIGTAYFLMPSNMPNGMAMGDWSITVKFDGQEQSFPVTVDMKTSDVKKLKGDDDDQIMDMEDTTNTLDRTYYLFSLGRHVDSNMNMFSVYIAAKESMMTYPSVVVGNLLNAGSMYELDIATVSVEMCITTCDAEGNWITAISDTNNRGAYKGMNLGLTGDDTDSIHVRLSVNNSPLKNGEAVFSFSESTDSPNMNHSM